jgi:4-hydroxy-tetrahydrodipicolinate synthase/2-dehydro-3-deoxy-phosphogluconate/2-dehydro-3-deoxy-6-phosphogalactonate aldolase
MSRGILLVALLTPFTPQGDIHTEALQAHVADLSAAGMNGYFLCGTTGEGPLLDDDEVLLITRTVLGACSAGSVVITQVGRPSTKATLRLLDKALSAGAHGATAVTPYYYELDGLRLEVHYRQLLNASNGRPLYAYVIPRRTGNDIDPDVARRLAHAGLAGIKDSTRSIERHCEYLKIASELNIPFEVYMGTDGLAVEALRRGSTGIVSAIANLHPELFLNLRNAVLNGCSQDAISCQDEINQLRTSLQQGDTIANLKLGVRRRLEGSRMPYPSLLRLPLGVTEP